MLQNNNYTSQKKIGLALSGASSRSIFYIGFLEAMEKAGVHFDYIAACSGATIVAGSYAAGTLDLLKQRLLSMKRKTLFQMLEYGKASGGIYNLDTFEEVIRFYTKGMRFEDAPVAMGFVASDIVAGKQVVLNMGDIARAARISCTLPGLCEPVFWGNKVLVDGGLLSVVPGDVAREAGCAAVVGIDMRGNRHIFSPRQIQLKKIFNAVKSHFLVKHTVGLWQRASANALNLVSDYYERYEDDVDTLNSHSVFSVVNRALDIAIDAQKHTVRHKAPYGCDLLIVPESDTLHLLKRFMRMVNFDNARELYELGVKVGVEHAERVKEMRAHKK